MDGSRTVSVKRSPSRELDVLRLLSSVAMNCVLSPMTKPS
jgi:hypothetical protein